MLVVPAEIHGKPSRVPLRSARWSCERRITATWILAFGTVSTFVLTPRGDGDDR
jgi:hypothetical protein